MPDVTASGYIGAQIEAIRYAFAASTAFKTLTGASTTAIAHDSYTFANWYTTGTPTKPFIVVMRGELSRQQYAVNTWQQSSSLLVRLEYVLNYDPYTNPQKAITDLENMRDAIMVNVEAASGTTVSYGTGSMVNIPCIHGWRVVEEGARFSNPQEDGYFAVGQTIELQLGEVYG
jgi:hypothetical protein